MSGTVSRAPCHANATKQPPFKITGDARAPGCAVQSADRCGRGQWAEALGRGPSAIFRGGSPISPLWLGPVFVARIPEQSGCIQRCLLFRKREGLCGLAHSVQSLRHLHGRGDPQRWCGPKFSFGEAIDLPKIPSRFSTRFLTRGRLPHRLRNFR